ncbi:MAG TPA: hypothetical protein DDW34_09695 [Clostridium sp.]|nr:hypothetical protein [Clostridium sp.]
MIGNKEMIHQLTSKIKPNKYDFVDTKKINARMECINKQLSKLIDLYQVGTLPMEILTSKVEALVQEKNMLLERQNVKEDKTHTAANFIDTLNTFETYFETFDLDAKRMLIATLIECIKIDGKNVQIKWRL